MRSPGRIDSPLSREAAFLGNNVLFALFAFVVLLGTVFPLLVEAINSDRVSVGSPYFNRMVLGDVVVERIEAELGGPADFGGGLRPSEVSIGQPQSRSRWDRDNFPWRDWGSFAARYEFKTDAAVNG